MAGQVRLFQNQGSAIVYIGGVNVMVGTGYPLSAGLNPQPVFLDLATNGAWYAVAGSAQNVLVDSIY